MLLSAGFALFAQPASCAITMTEVAVPTAGSNTFDIALGPDGALWFTEYGGNKIGRCTLAGTITNEYVVPTAASQPSYIVAGPDGNLWFTEFSGNKIGSITTAGVFTEHNIPTAACSPWGLTVGPDGNLWFTEEGSNKIGRCTTAGVITEFSPAGVIEPRGIVRGPDGNLWFVEDTGNTIDKMSTAGALLDRYPIPTPVSHPWGIGLGADGNLWFTESAGNKVGRCTVSGAIIEFPIPTVASDPIEIRPGPDGALWFCERAGNKIGRCTTSGVITETTVPTAGSQPMVTMNAPDGSIWFGETTADKLCRLVGYSTPTWYLAEGSTEWGFSTYITIENTNAVAVNANVTYMPTGAPPVSEVVALPANSQSTLTNEHLLGVMGGPRDFSTKVECPTGQNVAVDRTMEWTGPGAAAAESHNSVGVTAPARRWYLAEGSSNWGFECFLLIQNPTAYPASCQVTYMIEGEAPQTFTKPVAANSRNTFNMFEDIGERDASIQVVSNVPVIPERAMYRDNRREGHDSIGSPTPALEYFLAEGTTAWNFTTYLLVQNPQPQPVDVTVTYQTAAGATPQPIFTMPANSRETINVNSAMPNVDLSISVKGTLPIIAERAMYLPSVSGEICHDSIGFTATHTNFYLPDGETSNGRETFTLVQNSNTVPVNIRITYMTPSGAGNVVVNDTVPASSRKTYNMADNIQNTRASVFVECTTAGRRIMCERAMYWNGRQAATNTIGGFTD
ncbi:MAG: Vgb family protein [Candidatus Geothermincolia bacterium]